MPARVGPYAVLEVAHEGQDCVVYRCRDIGVERTVAVKALRPVQGDTTAASRRLRREATARSATTHPNVLPLFRALQSRDGPLLVGPWLDGGTLGEAGLPLPPHDAVELADGIGTALDAVHASGWWHGDVAAGNVLLAGKEDGDRWSRGRRPVLADFGTARHIGVGPVEDGQLMLTPAVTAPEVWAGRESGPLSDLYSLGVLVYWTVTGRYPFVADDPEAYRELHLGGAVPLPSDWAATVGRATEVVLLRALAKRPEARFQSGAELAAALQAALVEDGLRAPAGPQRSSSVSERRRPARPPDALGAPDPIGEEEPTQPPPPRAPEAPAGAWKPSPKPDDAVQAAGESLERFAASLDGRERAALCAMLQLARTTEARGVEEVGRLSLQLFGVPQALLALEQTGAAAALASGPKTPAELAILCSAPARSLGQVVELLACVGVLRRVGDEVALSPALEAVYGSQLTTGAPAEPFCEAAELWSRLPAWAGTGTPALEMDEPDGARYAPITPCLGTMFAADAEVLAAALVERGAAGPRARILDVGAGSGVWSLALVAAIPDASVVALDRPRVLETTRAYAEAAGLGHRLTTLAGDWRDAPLPSDRFDVVVMANICHLEPGQEVACMIERVSTALRPGGTAVIVDTIPRRLKDDAGALLQSIHLGLRTPLGGLHEESSYRHWLGRASLVAGDLLPLRGNLTALLATRPR